MEWWKFVVLIVCSYLIGNIFFARILSKWKKFDLSKNGSGNPGTMNMLRTQGFKMGLLTLLLDMLKGVIPAICGFYLFGGEGAGINAYIGLFVGGISALVGNIFPIFYKFKGGKGAAIVYGMYCVAQPLVGLCVFIGGLIYLCLFEYAAVLSFTMVTFFTMYEAYTLWAKFDGNLIISFLLFTIFCLMWFAHRKNIYRLLVGKENTVSLKDNLNKFKNKMNQKKMQKRKDSGELG